MTDATLNNSEYDKKILKKEEICIRKGKLCTEQALIVASSTVILLLFYAVALPAALNLSPICAQYTNYNRYKSVFYKLKS